MTASTASVVLERYRSDPVAFCREILDFEPWSLQRAVLESVRDHVRTAVRSCHGPGKTAIAARAALWFLAVHEGSKVITTAPTALQVRQQLWKEIAAGYHASRGWIGGELYGTRLDLGPAWFAVGFATDRAERFAGWHAEHVLLIADEASGVPEDIFEAAAGSETTEDSRTLLIGNPTKTSGTFFSAFNSARDLYSPIRISAFECPAFTGEQIAPEVARRLVSRRWVDDRERLWGRDSPLWQVRVAAEFPSQSDDVVISLGDLERAQTNELESGLPLVLSCDVARFGSDQTVLAVRQGNVVRLAKSYTGRDLMRTVGEIARLGRALEREHGRSPMVVVDDAGLGGGVVDRLREQREFQVIAYNASRAAQNPREYPNRRSESWFSLAERIPELDLPPDEELAADLLAPRYSLDSQGRRVVEPKSDTKRRLRRSPDRGDAVVMAFAVDRRYRPARTSSVRRVLAARS